MSTLDTADLKAIFRLPPADAMAYLKAKGFAVTWDFQEMLDAVHQNFESGGRPNPWQKSKRAIRDGGKTLQDSGRLYRSITPRSDATSAVVGTNVVYARYLQFGTRAHTVAPKRAKALRIPGVGFRKKAAIPAMEARPFLVLTDADTRKIVDRMKRHLVD